MFHHIALSLLKGVTQMQALAILQHGISPSAFFDNPQHATQDMQSNMQQYFVDIVAQHGQAALLRAEEELAFCERHDIQVLCYGDAAYPQALMYCPDPPLVLFYKGRADLNARRILSVVGTRKISPYGQDLCQSFCRDLAQMCPEVLVVSGLAYGVDVHTHRACLHNDLATVGVVAHGLDRIYPPPHRETAKAMLQKGGLITEYISKTGPLAGNFVRRNRIIAGLSAATLLIESADKGGALITAKIANDYDRMVLAFPGRSVDPTSAGCNALIRDQMAQLVTSAADVLTMLGWDEATKKGKKMPELFPILSEEEQIILNALRQHETLTLQQLCIHCNLPHTRVTAALFELEMNRFVALLSGGRYRMIHK